MMNLPGDNPIVDDSLPGGSPPLDSLGPTTLRQVETLFQYLHENKVPEVLDEGVSGEAYELWKRYVDDGRQEFERWYTDDGKPSVYGFDGTGGFKIAVYRYGRQVPCSSQQSAAGPVDNIILHQLHDSGETPRRLVTLGHLYKTIDWQNIKGVIVHCHGITENARFELLTCKGLASIANYKDDDRLFGPKDNLSVDLTLGTDMEDRGISTYETSWIQTLVDSGFVVFTMDLQGHGLSEAWKGSRCNVPAVEYYVRDVIALTKLCVRSGEIDASKPLFMSGLSMGGCVLARTLEIGFGERHFRTKKDPEDPMTPLVHGSLFWCPALSAGRLKKKFPNCVLLPFAPPLSKRLPTLKVAKLQTNVQFPFITMLVKADPLVYTEPVPVRIGYDVLQEMDKVIPQAGMVPADLPVVIIQSQHDTMVDPEGSKKFLDTIDCEDKKGEFLDFGWHYLSREPGYAKIINRAIKWLKEHID